MSEQFLTTEEVSFILNISVQSVIKLIKSNSIQAIRLGRLYRIPYSEIERLRGR